MIHIEYRRVRAARGDAEPANKSFQPTKSFVTALAGARLAPNAFAAEANVSFLQLIHRYKIMSITRNALNRSDDFSKRFEEEFSFFLDELDNLFELANTMVLQKEAVEALNQADENLVRIYLFLMKSANTTIMGILRLLSGNFYSDAFALLRILHEIVCLLHYGNISRENKEEIYNIFWGTTTSAEELRKKEWRLILKAEQCLENESSNFSEIKKMLNNYGAHISKEKMVLGNVGSVFDKPASKFLTCNFHELRFIMALGALYNIYAFLLEEYNKSTDSFPGLSPSILPELQRLVGKFDSDVDPILKNKIKLTRRSS